MPGSKTKQSLIQSHFDWRVPQKDWFTPEESTEILPLSANTVRIAFDNGKICGFAFNAKAKKGEEKRQTRMIPREFIVQYLLECANYDPQERLDRLCGITETLSPQELMVLQRFVSQQLQKKQWKHS